MKTPVALGLSGLMLLTAFSINARSESAVRPAFTAEISGDISGLAAGDARFGVSGGIGEVLPVFTISLGANGEEGSILFTRRSGAPLSPGIYTVSDRPDSSDDVRALVITGSATHPTGVFQGQSGALVITSASDRMVRGSFRIEATGFLAAEPEVEGRPVAVKGSFIAAAALWPSPAPQHRRVRSG